MSKQRLFRLTLYTISIVVFSLSVFFATAPRLAQQQAHAAGIGQWKGINPGIMPMHPMYNLAAKMGTNNHALLPCMASIAPPLCYTPRQIRQAYNIQPCLDRGITGKGRIITIIDAFQDPTVREDLRLFDALFGLQDPQLNIFAPFGLTPFNAKKHTQTSFAGEIALDIEWAHVIAPEATINLVLANVQDTSIRGQLAALLQATDFAIRNNMGSVISQSFGASEACLDPAFIQTEHQLFQKARAQQQTVFASAGDSGAAAVQCNANGQPTALTQGIVYPASDPLVTSVGGTKLIASQSGTYQKESVWNESDQGDGATGGGVSKIFPLPAFQKNVVKNGSNMRMAADIAFDADPLTGVPVVTSSLMPGSTMIIPIGGTSLGAPMAAGMTALFDQAAGEKRLGFLNSALYRIGQDTTAYAQAFHNIKMGNNTFVTQDGQGKTVSIPGFDATDGWNPPTGLGTPRVAELFALLTKVIKPDDGADL